MGEANAEFFDDLINRAVTVRVRDEDIELGIPPYKQLLKIRAHVAGRDDFPKDYDTEEWMLEWHAMCLKATVVGLRDFSIEDCIKVVQVYDMDDDEGLKALTFEAFRLCGYQQSAEIMFSDRPQEKIDELLAKAAEAAAEQPAKPDDRTDHIAEHDEVLGSDPTKSRERQDAA